MVVVGGWSGVVEWGGVGIRGCGGGILGGASLEALLIPQSTDFALLLRAPYT